MKNLAAFALALYAFGSQAAAAEPDWSDTITPKAAREDLDALYAGLKSGHFDLFANRTREAYDQKFSEVYAGLDSPLTRFDLFRHLQKFAAFGDVAHARIDFPIEVYGRYRDGGGKSFPIYLRIIEGRAYVDADYSGTSGVSPGDELLAIDGTPIATWLNKTSEYLSADTPYIAHSILEFAFPMYLWVVQGPREKYEVTTRAADGQVKTTEIPALTRNQIDAMATNMPARFTLSPTGRTAKMLTEKIAYLRPGPFYNFEKAENIWDNTSFVTFIDQAFSEYNNNGAAALIIDLRDNPGGDSSFSDPMISWIADTPFRFASTFSVKSSDEAAASNQARLDQNPDAAEGMSGVYAKEFRTTPRGDIFTLELPYAQPRQGAHFDGDVYVLINRHSYSNAVTVAAIFQDYGWADIAGEKTADLATTLGAMETFELANSRMSVGFPKARIIRPSGDTRVDGVTPDIKIETPIVSGARDEVLERLIEIIEARH